MKLQVTESFYFSEDIRQPRFHAIYCNFSSVLFFSLPEIVQSHKFLKKHQGYIFEAMKIFIVQKD